MLIRAACKHCKRGRQRVDLPQRLRRTKDWGSDRVDAFMLCCVRSCCVACMRTAQPQQLVGGALYGGHLRQYHRCLYPSPHLQPTPHPSDHCPPHSHFSAQPKPSFLHRIDSTFSLPFFAMSAIVLAGLELTSGAEPTAIITEESELPRSAICHITRATLVPTAGSSTTPATFYLKASISDSQDIVLAAVNSAQPTVGLDLVFHADSTPMFSVSSVPELKAEQKQKFSVHLSGYVDVEIDEEDMDDDDDDGEEADEPTAEEMAAMREAIKRGDFEMDEDDEDDDEDEEDQEANAEGEDQEEDEEEEEKEAAPAPAKKAATAAAAGNKRKQPPTKESASTLAAKQQKTAATAATTTPSTSAKQAKSNKQSAAAATPTTVAASSSAATILPSGLTIQDEVVGDGAEASHGRRVSIRYKGQLVSNGKVFDSNMPKGQPFVFTLGGGECIEGFDKGVKGMRVGGRRVIVVPSELGYGKKGSPPSIPPNAPLKFTIELIKA